MIPSAATYTQQAQNYLQFLTYGLPSVGATNLAPVVPAEAHFLIATRFPYLSVAQLNEILYTTELPSDVPLDDGSGWARINLFAAAGGYGAFRSNVTVAMNAALGGLNAFDVWSNNISGPGGLTLQGSGTLILAGNNTYTGGTSVQGGTLAVTGSLLGPVSVSSGASFVLGSTGLLTGDVTSSGSVDNSGTISGSVLVNGGTFAGSGSTGALTVATGGVFSPGSTVAGSSAVVNGNLVLQPGSSYLIGIGPAGAASFANVTGTAALGGANVGVIHGSGVSVSKRYTILTAGGGVAGSFGGPVTTNLPSGFQTGLSYDPTHAYLDVSLNVPTAASSGTVLSANQQAVANALAGYFDRAGSIPLIYGMLTATGLSQASGEIATGAAAAAFQTNDQLLQMMLDPFAGTRADAAVAPRTSVEAAAGSAFGMATKAPPAAVAPDARWRIWGGSFGGGGSLAGDAATGSHDLSVRNWGMAVGADYRVNPDAALGFAVAGGGTGFALAANPGSGRSETFQAGAYGSWRQGPAYVSGAASYGWHELHTERSAFLAGLANRLEADFHGNVLGGRVETGWRLPVLPSLGITPFAAGEAQWFATPSYAETDMTGLTAFALSYARNSWTDTRSELGARFDHVALQSPDVTLMLRGRAAWGHAFSDDRSIDAVFQALPGAGFTVAGALPARDAMLGSAGAVMKLSNGFTLRGTFEGRFAGSGHVYSGTGSLSYAW